MRAIRHGSALRFSPRLWWAHALSSAAAFVLLQGCSIKAKASDAGDKTETEFDLVDPEVTALYGSHPPASPGTLRGVWKVGARSPDGVDTDLRLRFTNGQVVGGARCGELTTGSDRTTNGDPPDREKGSIDIGDAWFFSVSVSDGARCGWSFAGGTYDFSVDGLRLKLTPTKAGPALSFEKIGD